MGKDLYGSEPVFRAAVDQCAKLLEGLLPRPLLEATREVLLGTDKRGFHDAVPCFISGAILCLLR